MKSPPSQTLFIFGLGFSAHAFVRLMKEQGHHIIATTRSPEKAQRLAAKGYEMLVYDSARPLEKGQFIALQQALQCADAVISSIAPNMTYTQNEPESGDPVLRDFKAVLAAHPKKPWLAYLSSASVYGDHAGAWVDETTPCAPTAEPGHMRLAAEAAWQTLAREAGLPLAVLRLSAIYGPGRGPLAQLQRGAARRVGKPGQVFNRVHVADIAEGLRCAFVLKADGVFNLTDDLPAAPEEVVAYGAKLLGLPAPPLVPFEEAGLSERAKLFYQDNKRVSNHKSKTVLDLRYRYPDYKLGLAHMANGLLAVKNERP